MRARRIALCFTTSPSQLDWERSCEVVIKIQWDGATFHLEGTVTWTRVGSGHLPPRVLILEHLIGARDNNVGGSDVSPCRWRGICCTSFCVRSPLRNLMLSAAKLWRATVRSIELSFVANGWVTLIPAIEEISSIIRLRAISVIPRLQTARGAPTCWSIKYRPLIREQLSAPGRCCPEPPLQ